MSCSYSSHYSIDNEEAGTIIDLVYAKELRKARNLVRRAKRIRCFCERVGDARLDDAVPDEWYDVWKEFEGFLTNRMHYQGEIEEDVEEEFM